MVSRDEYYSYKLFLNSVLPLVKVIVQTDPKLSGKFEGMDAVVQISALHPESPEGKVATHFLITDGVWEVKKGVNPQPDVELQFKNVNHLNEYFKGKSKKLPKIRGILKVKLLVNTLKALMKMANLLGSSDIPEKKEDAELLTKLYFYLLSSGISQLNKCKHPGVSKWVGKSPDRVYAWRVEGMEEVSAYLRIKAGKSKSSRGIYKRSKPFFTMYFDSVESALGILLEKDNLIESTSSGKLTMMGAPEYGAQIGEYMTTVGQYVKAL